MFYGFVCFFRGIKLYLDQILLEFTTIRIKIIQKYQNIDFSAIFTTLYENGS